MPNDKRLIDANDAIEKINSLCVDGNENWIGTDNQSFVDHADVVDILSDAPTVDAVEVVHGRWEKHLAPYTDSYWTCTRCNGNFMTDAAQYWSYCPNCGTKMDGGADDA